MSPAFTWALALTLLPAAADDAAIDDVKKAITALNAAFQKGDAEAVGRWLTDKHVAITPYYGGPQTKAEQLKSLADLKLTEYGAGAMEITPLTKDAVLVRYPLTLKGTFKGKAVLPRNYATAVWVRQGGKWLEASYQETALGGE